MAKLSVRCSCGNTFTVDQADSNPDEPVKCPSCGKSLRIQVKRAAPAPVEEPAGSRSSGLKIILGAAVAAIVVLGVVIVILATGGNGKEDEGKKPVSKYPLPPAGAAPAPAPPPTTAAAPPPPKVEQPPPPPPPPPRAPGLPPPPRTLPAATAAAPAPKPRAVQLPAGMAENVTKRILDLPAYYRDLCVTAAERARIMRLISTPMVQQDDVDFLKEALGREKVKLVHEEKEKIRKQFFRLESEKLKGLPVDKIVLKTGQEVHGIVLGKDANGNLRIERLLSRGRGVMPYRPDQIKSVEKGKGLGGEFEARWKPAVEGTTAKRLDLMTWCIKYNLESQAKLVAHLILRDDPGHEKARAEAGLRKDPFWLQNQIAAQGKLIDFDGRQWLPRELKVELIQRGYLLSDGKWFKAEEKAFTLPGLMQKGNNAVRSPEIQLKTWNIKLNHDSRRTFKKISAPGSISAKEVAVDTPVMGFYSPTIKASTYRDVDRSIFTQTMEQWVQYDKPIPVPGTIVEGYVLIKVEVGEPIHSGTVKILADVKGGSRMEVFLVEGDQKEKLYAITKRDLAEHELPDSVRGRSTLTFDVRFSMAAAYKQTKEDHLHQSALRDRKTRTIVQPHITVKHERLVPDYGTKLFPSKRNTRTVFKLAVKLGRPEHELNALFEGVPPSILR